MNEDIVVITKHNVPLRYIILRYLYLEPVCPLIPFHL